MDYGELMKPVKRQSYFSLQNNTILEIIGAVFRHAIKVTTPENRRMSNIKPISLRQETHRRGKSSMLVKLRLTLLKTEIHFTLD